MPCSPASILLDIHNCLSLPKSERLQFSFNLTRDQWLSYVWLFSGISVIDGWWWWWWAVVVSIARYEIWGLKQLCHLLKSDEVQYLCFFFGFFCLSFQNKASQRVQPLPRLCREQMKFFCDRRSVFRVSHVLLYDFSCLDEVRLGFQRIPPLRLCVAPAVNEAAESELRKLSTVGVYMILLKWLKKENGV